MLLEPNEYWHGTFEDCALRILCEGFRYVREDRYRRFGPGGVFREGCYVTKDFAAADSYGELIIRCSVSPAIKVLWTDRELSTKVLRATRREFGAAITGTQFLRAIPSNKRLTKSQLVALVTHFTHRWRPEKKQDWGAGLLADLTPRSLKTSIRTILRRHGYGAVGSRMGELGICVMDPSMVTPVDLWVALSPRLGGVRVPRPVTPSAFVARFEGSLEQRTRELARSEQDLQCQDEKRLKWEQYLQRREEERLEDERIRMAAPEQDLDEDGGEDDSEDYSEASPVIWSTEDVLEARQSVEEDRREMIQDRELLLTYRQRHGIRSTDPAVVAHRPRGQRRG